MYPENGNGTLLKGTTPNIRQLEGLKKQEDRLETEITRNIGVER